MKTKIQELFSKAGVLRLAAELSDEERYDYTLRQIARNRAAWLLADGDGGGISMELGGKECICIWPEACYAEQFAQGEEGVKPKRIALDDLLDALEEMQSEEETAFAVFPTLKDVYVAPTDTFYEDLCEQAEQEEAGNPHINPHIWSAAPQKRYRNFLHTVCDRGAVWLARSGDAPLCSEQGLMLWPVREDAEEYLRRQGPAADCTVDYVDVLLFLHLTEAAPNSDVQIFPTEKDAFSMSGKALQEALEEELENY